MIVFRGAERLVQCDWCHRIATDPVELRDQWLVLPEFGLQPALAQGTPNTGQPALAPVLQPAQPAHCCPLCIDERTGGTKRAENLPSLRRDGRAP